METITVDSFKMNDDVYYVYVIYDSVNKVPIYIGKGIHNRALWHIHASKSGYHYNKKLEHKIKKITNEYTNMDNVQIYVDSKHIDESSALNRECELICEIGIENLCNLTDGGDNPPHSKSVLSKIVFSRRQNGRPWHTEETKVKIGNGRRGKLHSDATKRKFKLLNRKYMLGKTHSDATKRKMSNNHADFNGDRNPFYGKTHSDSLKQKFRLQYGHEWCIIHKGVKTSVIGRGGVKLYVDEYNRANSTKISYNSLMYYKKIKKYDIEIVNCGKWAK